MELMAENDFDCMEGARVTDWTFSGGGLREKKGRNKGEKRAALLARKEGKGTHRQSSSSKRVKIRGGERKDTNAMSSEKTRSKDLESGPPIH